MSFYLYLLSSEEYIRDGLVKLGCTSNPYSRLQSYQTSYPPNKHPRFYHIWETTATDREMMFQFEGELHDRFVSRRMSRNRTGDSEWFDFKPLLPDQICKMINDYIRSISWFKCESPMTRQPQSRHLTLNYSHNWRNRLSDPVRLERLQEIQRPIIEKIHTFCSSSQIAAHLYAPCGIGKTVMTCLGITQQKVIVVVPYRPLLEQWKDTLIRFNLFKEEDILFSLNDDVISREKFCVLVTNKSSNKIASFFQARGAPGGLLLIFDEAHHMAGILRGENTGNEGISRDLFDLACQKDIKRLCLTYTPRIVRSTHGEVDINVRFASMQISGDANENSLFGECLADIKLRPMIDRGILPDYRIWTLQDTSNTIRTPRNEALHILEAWNATESIGDHPYQPILHHLLIFVREHKDGISLMNELLILDPTLKVAHISDDLKKGKRQELIKAFTMAERAILINCKVLGEGVDLPDANAVATMYPKQSQSEIVQMLLRAGRFKEGKTIFHMLFLLFNEDDNSGFRNALCSLASVDEMLRDEIVLRVRQNGDDEDDNNEEHLLLDGDIMTTRILVETIGSDDFISINRAFRDVKRDLNSLEVRENKGSLYKTVRKINQEMGLKSRVQYFASEPRHRLFIRDPEEKFGHELNWIHFLGFTGKRFPSTREEFRMACSERGIRSFGDYNRLFSREGKFELPINPHDIDSNFCWETWFDETRRSGIERWEMN